MKKIHDFNIKPDRHQTLTLVGRIKVKLLVAISLVVLSLFFSQLVLASNLAVDGQKLSEIEEEIETLEAENTTLKVEISKQSSLFQLSKKAQEQGFGQPSQIIIL